MLSLNSESLLKLSSGISNIFLVAAVADNYICKVGSFQVGIGFQSKMFGTNSYPLLKNRKKKEKKRHQKLEKT